MGRLTGFLPCRGSSCAHKPRPHLYGQAPLRKPVLHHLAHWAPHLDGAPAAGERMPWGAADSCASTGSPCDSTSISIPCGTANFVGLPGQGILLFPRVLEILRVPASREERLRGHQPSYEPLFPVKGGHPLSPRRALFFFRH